MAWYKEMQPGKPLPPEIETPMVLFGKVDDMYLLSVGPLRISLTAGEREAMIETWDRLDKGLLGGQSA